MKSAAAWVPLVVLAMAVPVACQDKTQPKPPGGGRRAVAADRVIKINASPTAIDVTPDAAVVAWNDSVTFEVETLPEGAELEIDFVSGPAEAHAGVSYAEGQPFVGPFPKGTGEWNPRRGRYVFHAKGSAKTEAAEAYGYWKYQVIVRLRGGAEISVDPGVIIKDGI